MVDPNDSDRVLVFSKGAPEIVINHCSKYLNAGGEETDLDEEKKNSIVDDVVVNQFAKNALRTILVAYKSMSVSEYETLKSENNDFKSESDREVLEQDLTIIAIFALQDPLRPEIIEASVKCKKAGIRIRMVTGDNINTAKAIALEAGIITEEEMD